MEKRPRTCPVHPFAFVPCRMAPVNKGRGEGTAFGRANVFFETIFRHNILKNKGDPEGSPLFYAYRFNQAYI